MNGTREKSALTSLCGLCNDHGAKKTLGKPPVSKPGGQYGYVYARVARIPRGPGRFPSEAFAPLGLHAFLRPGFAAIGGRSAQKNANPVMNHDRFLLGGTGDGNGTPNCYPASAGAKRAWFNTYNTAAGRRHTAMFRIITIRTTVVTQSEFMAVLL